MSEDEKKAVEYWKDYMGILHWNTQLASEYHMKVLLDLIEKQQKELEKEKEKNKELLTGNIETIRKMLGEEFTKHYISKDKIREKIEYLDNQQRQWLEDRELKNSDEKICFARDFLIKLLKEEE